MNKKEKELPRGVFETSPGSCRFGIRITDAYGNRPEKVIGTRAEAVKAAKEARNERRRSRVLAPIKPQPTFGQIADLAANYATRRHADPSTTIAKLGCFCVEFGGRLADDINTAEIEAWLDDNAAAHKWSVKTERGYRSAIRLAYTEAIRLGFLKKDPTESIVYRRTGVGKTRVFTAEELERIRASIYIPGNHYRKPRFCRRCLAQLEIALQTGMRKSEQFRATWERIDWNRHVLFIPKSKNTQPRDVYLNSYALEILQALQADLTRGGVLPSGKIFPISDPRRWYEVTLRHAEIEGANWHTLRHTFATSLANVDVHIKFIQELLGHIDWESTARYIHIHKRKAFEAVALLADGNVAEYVVNKSYMEQLDESPASVETPLAPAGPSQSEVEVPGPEPPPCDQSDLPPKLVPRIPREELYELVWSMPVMHVARRLGRSDVAVAKTCRKRNIPMPGRGYWAKVAAGKPVPPRPTLPPL